MSEFRFGKTSWRKIEFLITLLILKNGRKTSAFLDGSYVTEPSSVRIGGREEFTPKIKVLRVDHPFCGCIAVESNSWILLLYSDNAASKTD